MALPKETITSIEALFTFRVPDLREGRSRTGFKEAFIDCKENDSVRFALREWQRRTRREVTSRSISLEVLDPENGWLTVIAVKLENNRSGIHLEAVKGETEDNFSGSVMDRNTEIIMIDYARHGQGRRTGSRSRKREDMQERRQALLGLGLMSSSDLPKEIDFEETLQGFWQSFENRNFTAPELVPVTLET